MERKTNSVVCEKTSEVTGDRLVWSFERFSSFPMDDDNEVDALLRRFHRAIRKYERRMAWTAVLRPFLLMIRETVTERAGKVRSAIVAFNRRKCHD